MAITKHLDEQIKRLQGYIAASAINMKFNQPSAEHIALEQALALAHIAREIATK